MKRNRAPSFSTLTVLQELIRAPQYGYGLMQLTGLKSGTLYPILMRLTDRGMLTSKTVEPEKPGRPPRQSYELTAQGRRFAQDALQTRDGNTVSGGGVTS